MRQHVHNVHSIMYIHVRRRSLSQHKRFIQARTPPEVTSFEGFGCQKPLTLQCLLIRGTNISIKFAKNLLLKIRSLTALTVPAVSTQG